MSEIISLDSKIALEPSWLKVLRDEFNQNYMIKLKAYLQQQKENKRCIYPKGKEIFNAFNRTPFDKVKVVIIGQDPYHGPNQAHGLCFSVRPGISIPPSLANIFKELNTDLDIPISSHGCLEHWAEQGVLLLNAVLTVEQGKAAAHQGKGWEHFTDKVIEKLNQQKRHLVFMLWGSYAQKKGQFIDTEKHCVLKAAHPSPLSAYRGFFGCQHFSKANAYLAQVGQQPIDWHLPTN